MHAANKAQEDLARKLQWDRKENRQYLIAHQQALGKRPEKYRKLSFAMTQGAFNAIQPLSAACAPRLSAIDHRKGFSRPRYNCADG